VTQCGNLIEETDAPGEEDAVTVNGGSIGPGKLADIPTLIGFHRQDFHMKKAEPTGVERAKITMMHKTILNDEIVQSMKEPWYARAEDIEARASLLLGDAGWRALATSSGGSWRGMRPTSGTTR